MEFYDTSGFPEDVAVPIVCRTCVHATCHVTAVRCTNYHQFSVLQMQQAHSVYKAGRGTNGNDDTVGHRPKSNNSHNAHRRCLRVRWRRLHYQHVSAPCATTSPSAAATLLPQFHLTRMTSDQTFIIIIIITNFITDFIFTHIISKTQDDRRSVCPCWVGRIRHSLHA